MTDKTAIAAKLLQIDAVKLSLDPVYTWASGWKSPIYCDNRKILSFPFVRDYIKSELCNAVFQQFPDANMIAGVATAGIPWGAMIADQLKLPYIYVRPQPKAHGLQNQIEGFIENGRQVVVVEDLISTGKSSLQVVDVLLQKGMKVEGVVSIFDYGFPEASHQFEAMGIKKISLTDYPSLIQLANEKGQIKEEDMETLNKWRENPSEWGK